MTNTYCMQVKKHLEADIKYLHKVRGSGAYSLTELADKLLPEVPVSAQNSGLPSICSSMVAVVAAWPALNPCPTPDNAALLHEPS